MSVDRRSFVATVAGLAASAAAPPPRAAATPALRASADDPLGVRADFPIVEDDRAYLNSAYIAPIPRPATMTANASNQMIL